ncbi:MAG: deoxyribonuclease IV [Thermodesulfobacteriota bacterium]|nr:deoxyribonuclease IV [Thermodesulfobacteriota bacterium]
MHQKNTEKVKVIKNYCLLGAHFSIAKGLHKALYAAKALKCNALQIFTQSASTWKQRILTQKEIELFEQAKIITGIKAIASHSSYLINPASYDNRKHSMSCNALKQELIRSSMLGIPFVVLHPGSHMGKGEKHGIDRIAESINEIFAKTPDISSRLLLETVAGQGSSIGHTFEQLASILDLVENKEKMGICLDTCHIFAAGYDIRDAKSYRKTMQLFDDIIGINHLYFMHLNDSKKALGTRIDRHEHIGKGFIGLKAFEYLMNDKRFKNIPKIIETPKEIAACDSDQTNLNKLRAMVVRKK